MPDTVTDFRKAFKHPVPEEALENNSTDYSRITVLRFVFIDIEKW